MNSIAGTWEDLVRDAGLFALDLKKFEMLHPFFESVEPSFFQRCASRALEDFPLAEAESRFAAGGLEKFLLLCIVANGRNTVECYRRNGWPERMLKEILGDLRLWTATLERDLGGFGLTPPIFQWCQACLKGDVKAFGRLEGNDMHLFALRRSLYRDASGHILCLPAFEKGNPPHPDLTYQDRTINVHIPASGPLLREDCIRSFRRMTEFSEEYHPDYDYKAVVCYSWLLDPQFRDFLKENSNIVGFQKLGHVFSLPETDENETVKWRIWGDMAKHVPLEELPAENSLERGVIEKIRSGGHFRRGVMVIFRDELPGLFREI